MTNPNKPEGARPYFLTINEDFTPTHICLFEKLTDRRQLELVAKAAYDAVVEERDKAYERFDECATNYLNTAEKLNELAHKNFTLTTRLTALEKVAAEMAGALVNACDLISSEYCSHGGHVNYPIKECGDHERCYAKEQHRALNAYRKFIEDKGG